MYVVKKDGSKQQFEKTKIVEGCKRSGASIELANKVADAVSRNAREGMTTYEIGKSVIRELKKHDETVASDFEKFFNAARR